MTTRTDFGIRQSSTKTFAELRWPSVKNLMVAFLIPVRLAVVLVFVVGCGSDDQGSPKVGKFLSATSTGDVVPKVQKTVAPAEVAAKPEKKTVQSKVIVKQPSNVKSPEQSEKTSAVETTRWIQRVSPDPGKLSGLVSAQNRSQVVDFIRVHSPTLKHSHFDVDSVFGAFLDPRSPQQLVLAFGAWERATGDRETLAIQPVISGNAVPGVTVVANHIRELKAHRPPIPIAADNGASSVDSFKVAVQIKPDHSLTELLVAHAEKHDGVVVLGSEAARHLMTVWLRTLPEGVRRKNSDLAGEVERMLVFADFSMQLHIKVIVRTTSSKIPPRLDGLIQNWWRARIDDVVAKLADGERSADERSALAQQLSWLTQLFGSINTIADDQLLELKIAFER